MTKEELEILEKWKMLSALSGININDLYDSNDDGASEVFECLERIEEHEAMIASNQVPFKIAQHARSLGLTSDKIWEYQVYLNDIEDKAERERLAEEERNNPRMSVLINKHKLVFTDGDSMHQTYWSFEADLGDGWRTYNCRYVHASWYQQRIWREWKDSAGKKQRDKFEFGGSISNVFPMDKKWPIHWQRQYGSNFNSKQLPYAYAHQLISKFSANKKKSKTV